MKLQKVRFVVFISLFTVIALWSESGKSQDQLDLRVEATTSKVSYLLGETVYVNFKATNISSEVRKIPASWGGNSVLISSDGNRYLKVSRGKWEEMLVKLNEIALSPGQSYEYPPVEVLFGGIKPDYSHLNAQRADELKRQNDRVATAYAFPKAGQFFIKGVLGHFVSEPTKIFLNEPEGEDLEVWRKIKDNENFAYMMQYGAIMISESKVDERAKFLADVQQILSDYPTSFYAEPLREGLAKFHENEEKRVNFRLKLRKPPSE